MQLPMREERREGREQEKIREREEFIDSQEGR
jgi:hypothetical protein